MKNHDILVIGSIAMDLIARVNTFPEAGQSVMGGALDILPGGKGSNQAVCAARLGGRVSMAGTLGMDGYGDTLMNLLAQEDIDASNMERTDKAPSALAMIMVNNQGENRIVVIPGANHLFEPSRLEGLREDIRAAKLVMAQLELTIETSLEIIRVCDELGVPLILNPAPAAKIPPEYLAKVSYMTPNETELAILADMPVTDLDSAVKAAKSLNNLGVKYVVATLGKNGALISTADSHKIVEGYQVEAVDTVAAGDSFNGALAVKLIEGAELEDAVRYANAVGALTVTKSGAVPSLPTKAEVQAFLDKNN